VNEWIDWVRRLRAISQNGLTYAKDPFDVERYTQLLVLAADIAVETAVKCRPAVRLRAGGVYFECVNCRRCS
jgi:hypothetical protein